MAQLLNKTMAMVAAIALAMPSARVCAGQDARSADDCRSAVRPAG